MGVSPLEFYDLTLRDISLLSERQQINEERQWLHTREIIAVLINTNLPKGKRAKKGSDIVKTRFDKKSELTIEEKKRRRKALFEKADKMAKADYKAMADNEMINRYG